MARHPFDPVSFVVGVVALAAGVVVLSGGDLTDEARVLLPAGLIALGVALVVNVVDRRPEAPPPPHHHPAPVAGAPTDHTADPLHTGLPTDPDVSTDPEPLHTGLPSGDPDPVTGRPPTADPPDPEPTDPEPTDPEPTTEDTDAGGAREPGAPDEGAADRRL